MVLASYVQNIYSLFLTITKNWNENFSVSTDEGMDNWAPTPKNKRTTNILYIPDGP